MPENNPPAFSPQELEAMVSISRVVAEEATDERTLDNILAIARPVFIFDNVVLYIRQEQNNLEPWFARAIGRGRSAEADLAWGEPIAEEAIETKHTVFRQENIGDYQRDRMLSRHFLGLPLRSRQTPFGALIFVRYGGPAFSSDQTPLAEYLANQVALYLQQLDLAKKLTLLEDERRLERLQDDFVATITHELCTPLGFIKGYATTLMREDAQWDDSTRREFLTIIDEESDRLRELIDNLLDSSRLQSGTFRMEFQPVRLENMLKDIVQRGNSFESLKIESEVKTSGLLVKADPTRLAQVFDNLFSNAVKYAPGSPLKITLEEKGGTAVITIRDFGPGIAPEHIDKIFTRFFRVPAENSSVRGTGLGLFISRRIIRSHGGDISARSDPGEGLEFTIVLPVEKVEQT